MATKKQPAAAKPIKGPWHFVEDRNGRWFVQRTDNPQTIFSVGSEDAAREAVNHRNAHEAKREAASEMLAALKMADKYLDNTLHGRAPGVNAIKLSQMVRAALAKAEGK